MLLVGTMCAFRSPSQRDHRNNTLKGNFTEQSTFSNMSIHETIIVLDSPVFVCPLFFPRAETSTRPSKGHRNAADRDETSLDIQVTHQKPHRAGRGTYVAVVLATYGLGAARTARADANDGDRGAVDSQEYIHVLDDDSQKTEEVRASGGAGLCSTRPGQLGRTRREETGIMYRLSAVAALDWPGRAS